MTSVAEINDRLARLETQVQSLKEAVKTLTDIVRDEVVRLESGATTATTTTASTVAAHQQEHRLQLLEQRSDELSRAYTSQTKAIRRLDDRTRKSFAVVAEALRHTATPIE